MSLVNLSKNYEALYFMIHFNDFLGGAPASICHFLRPSVHSFVAQQYLRNPKLSDHKMMISSGDSFVFSNFYFLDC